LRQIYRENQNTQCVFDFFFNFAVYEIMWEKCGRAGQATEDKMARAHCMLDN
jgi:hypothetical protein